MKFLSVIVIVAVFSSSRSALVLPAGTTVLTAVPIQSQFQTQDTLGQYTFGYTDGVTSKAEVRSLDGTTQGFYQFVDTEGKVQTVGYKADPTTEFRVAATTIPRSLDAVPEPMIDTPEVAKAKADQLLAMKEAQTKMKENLEIMGMQSDEMAMRTIEMMPMPVVDTPEVAKARAEHLRAVENEKARNSFVVPEARGLPDIAPVAVVPGLKNVVPGGFAYSINEPLVYNLSPTWGRSFVTPVVVDSTVAVKPKVTSDAEEKDAKKDNAFV